MRRHDCAFVVLAITAACGPSTTGFSQKTEPRKKQAAIRAYAAQIKLAQKSLKTGSVEDARKKLAATPPKLRGWEYDYLFRNAQQPGQKDTERRRTLTGDGVRIDTVAFTRDGNRLLVGASRKIAKVWNFVKDESTDLKGHTGVTNSVAVSPDGKKIATGGWDGKIFIRNAATGEKLLEYRGHNPSNSPPGDSQTTTVRTICFSPDGKQIVSVSYGNSPFVLRIKCEVKVWSVNTGKTLITLQGQHLKSRAFYIVYATFSPDGKMIATGGFDNKLRLWDTKTGKELRVFEGHTNNVLGVAFSPDGKRIATASTDRTLAVWDVATGKELFRLKGHKAPVFSVKFSPDGKRIVSGSWDRQVRIWEADTGTHLLTLGKLPGPVLTVDISPDGKRIAAGGGAPGRIADATVWDTTPAKPPKQQ